MGTNPKESYQYKNIHFKIICNSNFKKGGAEDKFRVPKQKNDYVN